MIKILYLEDEPFLAKIVCETLAQKNYEVIHLLDGGKAVDTFNNDNFDICVLDIMLPNKNGYQIAEEIRAINNSIPIIFLSAKDRTEDVVEGFSKGGNDYMRKPFSMEELMVRINNLLKTEVVKSDNRNCVAIGNNFEFYKNKQLLQFKEESIMLSYKESQVLEALVMANKVIVDRRDLLKDIWGDDNYFNSRNLDVYIRKLRKHFSSDPGIQILTLRGVGFRLVWS